MATFNFADFGPDSADLNSNFTDAINNVLCGSGFYIPAPQIQALTAALPTQPTGWLSVRSLDGSIRFFAGTYTKLFLLNNTSLTWDDVSKTATTYSSTQDVSWSMTAFGNYVIAVNQNDNPQVYQIGTDIKFRDLGGSPPRAGIVKQWGDFVALMRLTGNQNRAQWSGLNNAEFWTPGAQNSDFQDFPDGGIVQGSTETTNPIIFLESAIQSGTFVPGSPEIFTFQKIQEKRGAKSPKSIATRGSLGFFADTGGFFQIDSTGVVTPIGFERVDRTIFTPMTAYSQSRILGAIDPFYSRVYWALDYDGNGVYDKMLVYDWQLSKWTQIDIACYGIFAFATSGYTLDGLDVVSSSLDALPFSLDSAVWDGGAPVLGALMSNFKLGAFSGTPAEATVTTQEVGDVTGQMQRTSSTYAIVNTNQLFISIGIRNRRSDNVTWLPEQAPSSNTGRVRKRSRARFHRMKIRIVAGALWSFLKGIDVDSSGAGER